MATSSPLPSFIGVEDFAFRSHHPESPPPHSSDPFSSPPAPPLNTRPLPEVQDYSFQSHIYDEYSASRSTSDHEDDYTTEEDDLALVGAKSTRTSISSFPGSVLPDVEPQQRLSTPTRSPFSYAHPEIIHHGRSGSLSYKIKSPASRLRSSEHDTKNIREYSSGFRNPSSVRAMQMRDEEPFDDDPETTPQHRRRGSRLSGFSHRSNTSSPTKRSSRSNQSSPQKLTSPSKLKKEFPLVLLHCSLLPPTLALNTLIKDEALFEEVLPDEYWRRWKVLQDKVGKANEVRSRGVLIPHPRDEYDALEERLLESLELERPRLRAGHFMGGGADVDSGLGTESEKDTESESDAEGLSRRKGHKGPKCHDCGKRVEQEVEVDRKWEVKVYAANGLMRAGAWGAAWTEMEKVDVEVSVWMPEAVRRVVEGRLRELGVHEDEDDHHEEEHFEETEEERRQREIYGSPMPERQEKIDGLFDENMDSTRHMGRGEPDADFHAHQKPPKLDMQTLAISYLKGVALDKRSIFILLLSGLVLFMAMIKPSSPPVPVAGAVEADVKAHTTPETMISVLTFTTTAMATTTVVATSIALETAAPTLDYLHVLSPISETPPDSTLESVSASILDSEDLTAGVDFTTVLIIPPEATGSSTDSVSDSRSTESTETSNKDSDAVTSTVSSPDEEPTSELSILEQVVEMLTDDDMME